MAPPKKSACQEVRDLEERHRDFWQTYYDARNEERAFLDGQRYEDDSGPYNRDRRRNQIRGQETQDTIRYGVARATEKPRSVEARPIDHEDDPDTGEVVASLVERELSDPWKGFEECYEEAITDAREARIGLAWMEWDPECGPFGEILFSYEDMNNCMWDPAYHPHHPKCGWFMRKKRVDVEWARRTYKAKWLAPDREAFGEGGQLKQGISLAANGYGSRRYDDEKITLWECWYKNDRSEGPAERKDYEEIADPEERYLVCANHCGYRSPTQGDLRTQDKLEMELPETLDAGCPGMDGMPCGANLERVDAKQTDQVRLAFARGHRLVIMAPLSPMESHGDRPLYDGAWPIPKARSFPLLVVTSYAKPGRPMGPSDTTLMWDQQIASDNLRTLAVQRTFEHRNYWEIPKVGLQDHRGRRWAFREDQFNVMYRDASQAYGAEVKVHQGMGLDPMFPVAFEMTQAALTQYRGVEDMGLTPDNSKNIAASTVQQLTALGNVPMAHFNRRKCRALGMWYGVVSDYVLATLTEERAARLRIDNLDLVMNLIGDNFPNYDFVVEDTPDFTGIEKANAEASQWIMQVLADPMQAPYLDILAEANKIPRGIVRRIMKRKQQLEEQLALGGGPGAAGGLPMDAAAGADPRSEQIGSGSAGMNGGGMVPRPAG